MVNSTGGTNTLAPNLFDSKQRQGSLIPPQHPQTTTYSGSSTTASPRISRVVSAVIDPQKPPLRVKRQEDHSQVQLLGRWPGPVFLTHPKNSNAKDIFLCSRFCFISFSSCPSPRTTPPQPHPPPPLSLHQADSRQMGPHLLKWTLPELSLHCPLPSSPMA